MTAMSRGRALRISLFVLAWISLFHYETLRLNYLSPLLGRELPKFKLLYPPAGWIMFFNVNESYGSAEVYSLRGDHPTLLDPHAIFPMRNVLYDNIHRNVLVGVLNASYGRPFCGYLFRKFPDYDGFAIVYAQYTDVTEDPQTKKQQVAYRCSP